MRILTCTLFIFLNGCAPSLIVIDKDYFIAPESKVTFIPVSPEVINGYNPKDVEKAFKTDNRGASKILVDSLNSILNSVMADSLVGAVFVKSTMWDSIRLSVSDDRYLRDFICKIGKDSVSMSLRIPRKEVFDTLNLASSVYFVVTSITFTRIKSSGSPGFWMMSSSNSYEIEKQQTTSASLYSSQVIQSPSFESIAYSPPTITPPTMMYMGGGGGSDNLTAKIRYAIWDHHINKAIAYGEFEASHGIFFKVTDNSWTSLFKNIALLLISNSPFKK